MLLHSEYQEVAELGAAQYVYPKNTCPAPASSQPPDQRAVDLNMKYDWQLGNAS